MTKNTFLFGLGDIGLNYDYNNNDVVTHTKALLKNNNFNLIGVFDKKKNKLKNLKINIMFQLMKSFHPAKFYKKLNAL